MRQNYWGVSEQKRRQSLQEEMENLGVDLKRLCIFCGKMKPLNSLIKAKKSKFGRARRCYECLRKIVARSINKYRKENVIKNRRYRKTEKYRKYYKAVSSTPRFKLLTSASSAVSRAIKKGILKRMPCEVCGLKKTEGHHKSYLKKDHLKVNWLCKIHHEEWHMKFKPIYL